jgi:hypothetical protein
LRTQNEQHHLAALHERTTDNFETVGIFGHVTQCVAAVLTNARVDFTASELISDERNKLNQP